MAQDSEQDKQRLTNAWQRMLDAGTMAPSPPVERPRPVAGPPAPLPEPEPDPEPDPESSEVQPEPAPEVQPGPESPSQAQPKPGTWPGPERAEADAAAPVVPVLTKGGGRRSRGRLPIAAVATMALFALAAVAGVLVAAGVFSGSDDSSSSSSSSAPPPKRQAPNSDTVARVGAWPKGKDAFGVVVFVSRSDRTSADRRARSAARDGFRAGVLRSEDFRSLGPGRLVTFAGIYPTRADARRGAAKARGDGLAVNPYVRFFDSK